MTERLKASCPKTQTNSRLARRAVSIVIDPWRAPDLGRVGRRCRRFGFLRTRRENNVQQGDATLPGGDLDPGPGPHLDQNVLAGYATVALASILDPSGDLFSDAARPGQCPFSYWAQTWHSKIAIRDESQK